MNQEVFLFVATDDASFFLFLRYSGNIAKLFLQTATNKFLVALSEFDNLVRMLEHQGFILWKHKITQASVLVKMASIKFGRSELISLRFDKIQLESAKVQNYIFYSYD
jgi:hypothetical protein